MFDRTKCIIGVSGEIDIEWNIGFRCSFYDLPFAKCLQSYGTSPSSIGKSTTSVPFSVAMLHYPSGLVNITPISL